MNVTVSFSEVQLAAHSIWFHVESSSLGYEMKRTLDFNNYVNIHHASTCTSVVGLLTLALVPNHCKHPFGRSLSHSLTTVTSL
jgi:hypothetical protein